MKDFREIVLEWLKENSNSKTVRDAIEAGWEPTKLGVAVDWWKERMMCDPEENIEDVIDDLLDTLSIVGTIQRVEHYYITEAENYLLSKEPEDDVIGTVAVFLNKEPVRSVSGDRIFSCLVDICKGDKTIREALFREGVGNNILKEENLTFEIPDELAIDVYCWAGHPLLTKEVAEGHILTHTIIGFVIAIDKELAAALKVMAIRDFWERGFDAMWREKEVMDFSSYLQALCEDHQIDPPVPLE